MANRYVTFSGYEAGFSRKGEGRVLHSFYWDNMRDGICPRNGGDGSKGDVYSETADDGGFFRILDVSGDGSPQIVAAVGLRYLNGGNPFPYAKESVFPAGRNFELFGVMAKEAKTPQDPKGFLGHLLLVVPFLRAAWLSSPSVYEYYGLAASEVGRGGGEPSAILRASSVLASVIRNEDTTRAQYVKNMFQGGEPYPVAISPSRERRYNVACQHSPLQSVHFTPTPDYFDAFRETSSHPSAKSPKDYYAIRHNSLVYSAGFLKYALGRGKLYNKKGDVMKVDFHFPTGFMRLVNDLVAHRALLVDRHGQPTSSRDKPLCEVMEDFVGGLPQRKQKEKAMNSWSQSAVTTLACAA